MPGTLRVRVGDYRVLYTISDSDQRIRIIDVRHRSKAYGDR
jgi:mRNA-degrading endonuclease RelE of RelBE toxin-antitoxin system